MSDIEFIASIAVMDASTLYALVMEKPEYLTDGYYRDFARAIRNRYEEVKDD